MRLVLVLVLALTAGGCGNSPPAATPTRTTVTASGAGIMDSAPMRMSGTYEVTWTATGNASGCYHGANLRTTSDKRAAELLSLKVTGTRTGTVWVYDLSPGSYFVNANSGCDPWSFRFVPR